MSGGARVLGSAALAWAFYDFAYSLFSFLVVVRFLPSWIINDLDRPDWYISVTQVVVVLFVLVAMPLAGALADQVGRRRPLLAGFTVVAAGACVTLGLLPVGRSVVAVLAVAGIAVAFGQLALAQYDPLLADVAPPEARGRVSGLAVALGFAGMIFGIAVVAELIVGEGSKQRAFVPAGILFVLFALPALLLIREPEHRRAGSLSVRALARAWGQLVDSGRSARRYPDVARFLVGRFLYSDAIATLSAFLAVYMTRLGGFSERDKNVALGIIVLFAAAGALAGGRIVERVGPKRPLVRVLPVMSACVLLSAVIGEPWTIWVVSPVAGVTLGVVWTADRVFMLLLTPEHLRGQFFGFFNLASRVASAIGPLLVWSGIVWLFYQQTHWLSVLGASRVAVGALAIAALVGWSVIRPLPDRRGTSDIELAPAYG